MKGKMTRGNVIRFFRSKEKKREVGKFDKNVFFLNLLFFHQLFYEQPNKKKIYNFSLPFSSAPSFPLKTL